jgi:flagellar protein FliO/FliZ
MGKVKAQCRVGASALMTVWIGTEFNIAWADDKAVAAVSGNPVWTLLQILIWLTVIIIMAVLLIRFLAHRTQVPQKGSIEVIAARQLAPNRSVQVIQIEHKKFLVGVADQITLLADVSDLFVTDAESNHSVPSQPFAPVLAEALKTIKSRYSDAEAAKEQNG